jgi:RNA polymerase sigma factor (sigma-70 family)
MGLQIEKIRQDILNNNLDFLAEQYELHQSYCVSFLVSKKYCQKQDAEDTFSDAILLLRTKIIKNDLNNLTSLRNYLLTTCINKVRDVKRKKNRHGGYETQVRELFYKNNITFDVSDTLDISMSEICRNALRRLGDRCIELLKLFYFEEMSLKDIATLMKFSSSDSVKSTKSVCFKKWVAEAKLLREKYK